MYVCMYIYIHTYIYTHIYIYIHTYIIHIHTSAFWLDFVFGSIVTFGACGIDPCTAASYPWRVCVCVCVCVRVCVCTYICIQTCIHIHVTCIFFYICIYIYIYTYTYTYTCILAWFCLSSTVTFGAGHIDTCVSASYS